MTDGSKRDVEEVTDLLRDGTAKNTKNVAYGKKVKFAQNFGYLDKHLKTKIVKEVYLKCPKALKDVNNKEL